MADYIYLLENRLSGAQRMALVAVRDVSRSKGLTVFLVGGAVRDLTSGSPVRDLDVVVQGNALKLKKELELAGAVVTGTADGRQALFVRFPGGVRMEVGSTLTVNYPKPGRPVAKAATILEDLRRRDFTANAMALSLNDGSYGLLMDPLNGVADIENRELRLVSNYGFIEDPVRMIRAVRFAARLGWELEEKTKARYETGKVEGYISALDDFHRGYEAEEIVHEEDPLRVMRRLENEGWMQTLAPGWTTAKANVTDLEKVRESQTQLQMQGIHPDAAAINFPLLTAKMSAKEVQALKASFPRQGFVAEIDAVEGEAKEFAAVLGGRGAALASAAYRTIVAAKPEALLYVAYTTKSAALQTKLKSFMTEWPQARQKIPYALMQEMRITPEIEGYGDLVERLFFELMDGRLVTVEEMKAYLEPYSPPAPPPPVHLRRARSTKKDAKGKGKAKKGVTVVDPDEDEPDLYADGDEEIEAPRGAEEDEEAEDAAEDFDAVAELGGGGRDRKIDDEDGDREEEEEEEPVAPRKASGGKKPVAVVKQTKAVVETAAAAAEKAVPAEKVSTAQAPVKVAPEVVSARPAKASSTKAAATKTAPKKIAPTSVPTAKAKAPVPSKPAKVAVKVQAGKAKAPPVAAKSVVGSSKGSKTPGKGAQKVLAKVAGAPAKAAAKTPAKKVVVKAAAGKGSGKGQAAKAGAKVAVKGAPKRGR